MASEIDEYKFQLEQVNTALIKDSNNHQLQDLKTELEDLISLTNQVLQEQHHTPTHTPSNRQHSPDHTSNPSKSSQLSPAAHERSHSGTVNDSKSSQNFKVGELVLARWLSGDNAFYAARITTVTGSSTAPVYGVKFVEYGTTESVPASAVRPMGDKSKRSIEQEEKRAMNNPKPKKRVPAIPQITDQGDDGSVVKKPKKSTTSKSSAESDTGKKAWQAFASKGIRKTGLGGTATGRTMRIGEKSMFRTPESYDGKVGVIGSGKGMQKEIGVRGKHIHSSADNDNME